MRWKLINTSMRFYEFTTKPITPQQAKINTLKQQKERVNMQLKTEKNTQKKQKAMQQIQTAQKTLRSV